MKEEMDLSDVKIKDLDLECLIPNNIDNVIINIKDSTCELILPHNMNNFEFQKWKNTKGGIFYKDVKSFCSNKPYGKYVSIQETDHIKIARLISNEESPLFNTLKLIDGKIKDSEYMLLKVIKIGESLRNTNRYIEKNIDDFYNIKIIIPDISSVQEDSVNQINSESISLFD